MNEVTVEGRQPVLEALKSGKKVKKIYMAEGSRGSIISSILEHAHELGIKVVWTDKKGLERVAKTDEHQGVVAIAEPLEYVGLGDILGRAHASGRLPFVLALDQIQDPQNLGSIIRTAEAAGVHGIVIPKKRAAQITPAVIKASAGAVYYMPVSQHNIALALDFFKDQGLKIIGADVNGNVECFKADLKGPLVLVIGSEGKGMRSLVRKKCDVLVTIPMLGNINSLNAANAAAVLMYEVLRQRMSAT